MVGKEKNTTTNKIKDVHFFGTTIVNDLTESLRIQWNQSKKHTRSYRIHREENGEQIFEGETVNTAYTLLNQIRKQESASYQVVPVDSYSRENNKYNETAVYTFEELQKPEKQSMQVVR